jgi:hypothetical protein
MADDDGVEADGGVALARQRQVEPRQVSFSGPLASTRPASITTR